MRIRFCGDRLIELSSSRADARKNGGFRPAGVDQFFSIPDRAFLVCPIVVVEI